MEPWELERLIQLLWRMLLMVAACNAVRMTAMHVVAYGWVLVVAVGSSEMKVLLYDVGCVCVASVLVAIAARALGGMLGAAVAPSGPHLQRSERRSGLTNLRARPSPL